ncbi:MAG: NUDIX domain-containing protein [bacterium]|nr:NUDIX domain-containing protein [bacterium]
MKSDIITAFRKLKVSFLQSVIITVNDKNKQKGSIMKIKKSVGLIVLVEMPNLGLAAALQRRGRYDFEEGKRESWPGGCQVTVHGNLKEGEDFKEALLREAAEELGEVAAGMIYECSVDLVEVFHLKTEEKEVFTFAMKMDFAFVEAIRLGPSTDGLRPVRQDEIADIKDLFSYGKNAGVPFANTIAMFPDEKAALIRAFEFFS